MAPQREDSPPYLPSDASDDVPDAAQEAQAHQGWVATAPRSLRSRAPTRMKDPFRLRDYHGSVNAEVLRGILEDNFGTPDGWCAVNTSCRISFDGPNKSVNTGLEAEVVHITMQAAARTLPGSEQHDYLLNILTGARSNLVCVEIRSLWNAGKDLTLDARTANKRWLSLNTIIAQLVARSLVTYRDTLLPDLCGVADAIESTQNALHLSVAMLKIERALRLEAAQ